MNKDLLLCTGVGILGAVLVAKGRKPLWKIQRACVVLRAAGFQARECFDGAKARLNRWEECVSKAERES